MIVVGVYIYIYIYIGLWTKKILDIRGRTSCQIYRLALPLISPETLTSLSKSKISLSNAG